jgi:hypothetical protein
VLVTVGLAVGLAPVVAARFAPLHAYTSVPVPPVPLPVSVSVPPLQIGPLLVGAAVGAASTVADVVYTVAGLQPEPVLLTVTE